MTVERLDAWLRYRQTAVFSADAGLVQRARSDEAALRDAGLTDDVLDVIEDSVAEVVTQRRIAKQANADVARELQRSLETLTGDQRAQAEKTLAELRARAATGGLEALRARLGDAAVDAVLAREAEVTAAWDGASAK